MIEYSFGFCSDWKCKGSVLGKSALVAFGSGLLGIFIDIAQTNELWGLQWGEVFFSIKPGAYAGFVSVLGFLLIFRTTGAYNRFISGSQSLDVMGVAFFDSAMCTMTLTIGTKKDAKEVSKFKHVVVRLLSLLHASCCTMLEEKGTISQSRLDSLELINLEGIDAASIEQLKANPRQMPQMVYGWLNNIVTEAVNSGVVHAPPPIAGRIFTKLSEGFAQYEHCRMTALIPFPFPYAQTALWLLVCHWVLTPFVMCAWTSNEATEYQRKYTVFFFTFLMVGLFWSLVFVSWQLENPFGEDENDLPIKENQIRFNIRLRVLLEASLKGSRVSLRQSAIASLDASLLNANRLGDFMSPLDEAEDEEEDYEEEEEVDASRKLLDSA